MKAILIILFIFGLALLAAVAFALVPNLLTPAAPLLPTPGGATTPGGAATPTLAAVLPASTLPPAPLEATLPVVGGGAAAFNGAFAGTLTSDDGSTAPVSLDLTQSGNTVSGNITVGDGLTIDGGNCGAQAIPAGSRSVSGQVDPANPNHIQVSAGYEVQGFTITAQLMADLAPDGNSLNGQIGLSLPFLCGRNPVISGSLARQ